MQASCKDIVEHIKEDLFAQTVPEESVAEKILWFDANWKADGFTLGKSDFGKSTGSMLIGTAEGLRDKIVFICDSESGECQALQLTGQTGHFTARSAPFEYLELLTRYPEMVTGLTYVPINIISDSRIWINAYHKGSLQLIAKLAGCDMQQAPRILVERLYWWGISKKQFDYAHCTPDYNLTVLLRPLDKCGECRQTTPLHKCTACKFNLLCEACKCDNCESYQKGYDLMSQTITG